MANSTFSGPVRSENGFKTISKTASTGVVPNGMKMFQRAALKTAMEGDFDTGNVRYKARERYSFGVSDYRGIFGVEGA